MALKAILGEIIFDNFIIALYICVAALDMDKIEACDTVQFSMIFGYRFETVRALNFMIKD